MAADVKRGEHKRKRKEVLRKHARDHVYTFSSVCIWQDLYINKKQFYKTVLRHVNAGRATQP